MPNSYEGDLAMFMAWLFSREIFWHCWEQPVVVGTSPKDWLVIWSGGMKWRLLQQGEVKNWHIHCTSRQGNGRRWQCNDAHNQNMPQIWGVDIWDDIAGDLFCYLLTVGTSSRAPSQEKPCGTLNCESMICFRTSNTESYPTKDKMRYCWYHSLMASLRQDRCVRCFPFCK